MSNANSDLHAQIHKIDDELDRFERQAGIVFACTSMLTLASYSILVQVIP